MTKANKGRNWQRFISSNHDINISAYFVVSLMAENDSRK
ncbi:hypothetical protein SPLC1_S205490 [Arthrospira platensis C1]|nr:hypothetical protein SPLC1_S205490 [Arthrospira platensis C1]